MKKFVLIGIIFASAPFITFAQAVATSTPPVITVTVEPGLLPTSFLYFLDGWGEAIRTFFTFNKESKARLHIEYAKERAAEIAAVLKDANAKIGDVVGAKDNFNQQIADAAAILKDEKSNGADVSKLAKELDDEVNAARDEMKGAIQLHGDQANTAEANLRAKIAALSPTDPQIPGLTQALESITKEKEDATKENDNIDVKSEENTAILDDAMGKQVSAQKYIDEAVRLKARLDSIAAKLPAGVLASFTDLLNQAKIAQNSGRFEVAKALAKQVRDLIEKYNESELGNVKGEGNLQDGNSDAHGCASSTGYSWSEEKKTCVQTQKDGRYMEGALKNDGTEPANNR
jgi:hypothetical protein